MLNFLFIITFSLVFWDFDSMGLFDSLMEVKDVGKKNNFNRFDRWYLRDNDLCVC